MGWLGDVAGALTGGVVSGLFGMANAKDANENARQNSAQQHKWNVDDFQHRYQWTVDDMRSAGLNPILAATNGIGGSINGTAAAQTSMAPTPDMASAFNSANQISSNREIAKMQNEVAKGDLELRRLDINSAIEKRKIDQEVEKGRFELDKEQVHQSMRIAEEMKDAQIKNMVDRLRAEIEHWERQDMSSAAMASAAMASADAQQAMAAIAEKEGISRNNLREAQKILVEMETGSEAARQEWLLYLNKHPEVRGAVGLVSSFLDASGMALSLGKKAYFGQSFGNSSDWR